MQVIEALFTRIKEPHDYLHIKHKSATMTLDQYGHLFDDRLNDVADRLDVAARAADVYPLCTRPEIVDLDDKLRKSARL